MSRVLIGLLSAAAAATVGAILYVIKPQDDDRPGESPDEPANGGTGLAPNPNKAPSSDALYQRDKAYYDALGAAWGIPPLFLAVLSWHESRGNDMNTNPRSGARGRFQVIRLVLEGWNKKHPQEQYSYEDLFKPEVCGKLACYTLNNALTVYRAAGEPAQWNNNRWIALLVAGWNAGYSAAGGMALAIKTLRAEGHTPTINLVVENANRLFVDASGKPNKTAAIYREPQRLPWWQKTADDYVPRKA